MVIKANSATGKFLKIIFFRLLTFVFPFKCRESDDTTEKLWY